jgi:hypothetical protein
LTRGEHEVGNQFHRFSPGQACHCRTAGTGIDTV